MKNPLSIVLDAAQEHVNEIEGRSHSDATIARDDEITAAIRALREPARIDVALARAQRDWLLRLQQLIDERLEFGARAAGGQLDGVINLLDAILDSVEGYSAPLQRAGGDDGLVYVVPRNTDDGLSLCVFEDEHRARQYAGLHPGALVYPEMLMNDSAAGQFLIDSAGEEPADQTAHELHSGGAGEERG